MSIKTKIQTFFLKTTFFFLKKQGNVIACLIMLGLAYLGVLFWLAIYETDHKHPTSFYSTEPLLPLATPSKSKVLEKPLSSKNIIEESLFEPYIKKIYQNPGLRLKSMARVRTKDALERRYNIKPLRSDYSWAASLASTPTDEIKATMEAREYKEEASKYLKIKRRKLRYGLKLERKILGIYENYKKSPLPKLNGR